jgi:nucleoid DNA-binding protein
MKKQSLTQILARRSRTSESSAADALDHVVCGIVRRLRRGQAVKLPGLGVLEPRKPKRAAAKTKGVARARR